MFQRGKGCERIIEILRLMDKSDPAVKDALKEDLKAAIADDAEYAGAIRSLLQHELGSLPT